MSKRRSHFEVYRPVVWVVGASRGIGKEIAAQFARLGCRVCLSGRNAAGLRSAARRIALLGGHAVAVPCDITKLHSIRLAAINIKKHIGEVDVVVNNAGITVFKSFLDTSLDEFMDILSTNLYGQIACLKTILPSMVRRKRGWVFNILSTAAVKTFKGSAAYTAAKAGMHGLSRVLREELRPFNIKIVDVFPGPTATSMWSSGSRKKHGHRMMTAKGVAESVVCLYQLPPHVVPEEIVLRPIKGDIE